MKKAFFVNGGSGRVLCSIPALEYYATHVDPDVVIVAEGWIELFLSSEILRNKVYPITQKDLFQDKLKDREIVTPEPYRLNAYFNQRANLIQAYDMIINDLDEVPETKSFNLTIGKADQVLGHNLVSQVKNQFQKNKVIVFQPFGSGAKIEGNFIIDESGRSFEPRDVFRIVEELGKYYGVIMMTSIPIPSHKPMPAIIPENLNLLQWMGIVNAADYFIGCDSVGQHFANALKKPASVVIGATFPENISYPNNKNFNIIDNGNGKRIYSPIRISMDFIIERNNEDLMILSDETYNKFVKGIKDKLGTDTAIASNSSCCTPTTPQVSAPAQVNPFQMNPLQANMLQAMQDSSVKNKGKKEK